MQRAEIIEHLSKGDCLLDATSGMAVVDFLPGFTEYHEAALLIEAFQANGGKIDVLTQEESRQAADSMESNPR